jgi:hypothetical protein
MVRSNQFTTAPSKNLNILYLDIVLSGQPYLSFYRNKSGQPILPFYLDTVMSWHPTVQNSFPSTWTLYSLPAHSTDFLSFYLYMGQSGQPTVQGSYPATWTWFSLASPQYRVPIPLPGHGSVWPAHSTGFLSLYLDMVQSGQPSIQGSDPST